MAKRATARKTSSGVVVVSAPSAPTRRRSSSVTRRRSRKGKRHYRGNVGGGGGFLNGDRVGAIIGGFVLGMLDKNGTSLPTVPMLGRAGTLGVGLYFAGKQFRMPILVHGATAALAIASYQLGSTGKIAGVEGFDTV